MNTLHTDSVELMERPEPRFAEGRSWPRTGWDGRVLWSLLVLIVAAAVIAACTTEMTVHRPVSGSVVSANSNTIGSVRVALVVEEETSSLLQIGQPVRLRINEIDGWSVIISRAPTQSIADHRYTKWLTEIVGPAAQLNTPPGLASDGHALIGFTSTAHGMWLLATAQSVLPTRTAPAELRLRIPESFRKTERYKRIEQRLNTD